MKKSILTLLILVGGFTTTQAQFGTESNYYERYRVVSHPRMNTYFPVSYKNSAKYIKGLGIDTLTIRTAEVKKGKEKPFKYGMIYAFNGDGKVVYRGGIKDKKQVNYSYEYLQGNTLKKESKFYKKGELKEHKIMLKAGTKYYDGKTSYIINHKGDTIKKRIVGRRDTINLTSDDYFYHKGKLKFHWHNEFYPNKSKKRTVLYDGKGKEKYVWDYQCKKEGVEVKKHKDTSTICVSREYDKDSILTEVHHTVGEKGKLYKTVNKYNRKGKWLYAKRMEGADDKLRSETINTYATDDTTLLNRNYTYYRKNTKHNYLTRYDAKGNITSSKSRGYKKGKLVSDAVTRYVYDATGRPIKKIRADKAKGTQWINYFSY